ncbi:sensor histidine kinase [Nocardioides jishulii]|uniref:Sensor histidine kinase n=1 Tax=Nocardioides jishulii TaxID=2575440 RepID=A0A4V5TKB7_9ACTN|nr:sensor histidine kinase [Nocardioides jishulii]QCX27139.1 sensor histidine kinase [Nocardioides jishulii]TKI61623.1 sensor histidine kinase [Nocardioides jishulii]
MTRGPDLQHAGLIEGSRAFVLLAVAAAVVWSRDGEAVSGLLTLATIWVAISWAMRSPASPLLASIVESALVSVVAGLYLDVAPALLAALVVPPFVHGLVRGIRGVAETFAVQILVLSSLVALRDSFPDPTEVADLFTWLVTGLGLGLLASFFVFSAAPDDGSAAYHEARALISELNALSGQLAGGLDPMSMGGALLDQIGAELPLASVVLHVQRDGVLLPLVSRSATNEEGDCDGELAEDVWRDQLTRVIGHDFAFPVVSSGATVAVVSGRLAPGLHVDRDQLVAELNRVATQLGPEALQLDTAQLFVSFRDAAMSEERRRLAREMHDGVAQDIASMGYVVDALISTATPQQEQALVQLRDMISRVVAEVRRSVMTLRTQAGSSESLGAAIATLARHLSDVSGTPIKVTVDERTSRLRHEVEAELLRIAQEAMNNAVKHSQAALIDVRCRVQAPYAEIVVSDDGLGLQAGRRDSHGLSIMRERAALIGGIIEVRSSPARGTTVSVRVGSSPDQGGNPSLQNVPVPGARIHRSAEPTSPPSRGA